MVEPILGEKKEEEAQERRRVKAKKEEAADAEMGKTEPENQYVAWLNGNPMVKPDDVAVFVKPDGSKMVIFTDGVGRSALNVSLHLSRELLDKLNGGK